VVAVVAFAETGSSFAVGLVGGLMFLPQLVLAPVGGRVADRGHERVLIIVGRALIACGSCEVAVLLWWPQPVSDAALVAWMTVGSLLAGLGLALSGPAMESMLPALVRDEDLPTAVALNGVPMILGRALGPVAGAVGVAVVGAPQTLMLSALLVGCHIVIMVRLALPTRPEPVVPDSGRIRLALVHLGQDRTLLLLLVGIALIGYGADSAVTLAPAITHALGAELTAVGYLATSFGIGAGIGLVLFTALSGRVALVRLTRAGAVAMSAGILWVATLPVLPVTLGAVTLTGTGMMLAYLGTTTQIQQRTPRHLRGRILSLWLVCFVGSRPLAGVTSGALADRRSVAVALAASVVLTAFAAVWCAGGPVLRLGGARRPAPRIAQGESTREPRADNVGRRDLPDRQGSAGVVGEPERDGVLGRRERCDPAGRDSSDQAGRQTGAREAANYRGLDL
jgi:MFS family permease